MDPNDEDDRQLAELHEEQRQMGEDPDYVRWLMAVAAKLDEELGESCNADR